MTKVHRTLLLAAVTAAATAGVGYAATCTFAAAEGLLAGSFTDSVLNPPKAEDVDFFTAQGGVPNIMLVLDSSAKMVRSAPSPNGLGTPLTAGIVGCGLDPVSAADVATVVAPAVSAVTTLNGRAWGTACGATLTSGKLGTAYDPTVDYAHEASACPKWVNPNPVAGSDGWDPDWYCGSGNTASSANLACSGQNKVNYFDRNLVLHDTMATATGSYGGAYDSATMTGDGWSGAAVMPHLHNAKPATIAEFCGDLKTKAGMAGTQGLLDTAAICAQCLTTKGWFFDGRVATNATVDDLTGQSVPSLWYTGNYLNFAPPKFLVARKVLKDTVMGFSKVRAAIAQLDSSAAEGAKIVQGFNPTCDHPDSNFDSNRTTYMSQLDTISFGGDAPLSRALLDVGLYYHSTTLPWFDKTWGARTPWTSGQAPGSNANSYAVCYACQTSSVILITDGTPTKAAEACSGSTTPLPAGSAALSQATAGTYAGATTTGVHPDCTSGVGGPSKTDCPSCFAFTGTDDYLNNLTRVAWYVHNFDLRQNSETTRDCQSNGGRQTVDLYTLNFGNGANAKADQLLANAAKVGGGLFASASNADQMRSALTEMLQTINTRSTSFSVATLSTLQSEAGHSVIVPRFDPAKSAFWRGHLYRFELYSEFINGCTPGGKGDLDCDGTCGGVFLQDSKGNFIQEDGTGAFKVNEPNLPSCAESKCGAGSCGIAGGADATPWWDAGGVLAQRTWSSRKVYTAVDTNLDGKIDGNDRTILLDTSDATIDLLIPYLNLSGSTACTDLAAGVRAAGDTATATAIAADATLRLCAKEYVRFLLGADVFNAMNRSAPQYPPTSSSGTVDRSLLLDRDWKLGDIFHSSPVVVDAPSPSDGVLCPRGLARQCITSLWTTPTPQDITTVPTLANAYDGYSKNDLYVRRRKIILVGSNDGLLHAFNGGKWIPNQDDPLTTGIDESKPPFNGYYERANSGDELWAFMPPDQLPKVPLLAGGSHYIYVDGTPMVRDVWVDGSANAIHSATTADDKKQPWEFHTVAVMPERRGGVHHFALDITDASYQATETAFAGPKFLWIYPQPSDPRILQAGETYSDFLPTPPPIGPVRVKADTATGAPITGVTPSTTDSTGATVPYHERWVAFLTGGFDPQYLRGQGVHMVDVWTGKELLDFSLPTSGSSVPATDPRWQLKFPVPATVSMVMWGKAAKNVAADPNEGFFDTATFGDAGGQLWVVRFNDPGVVDSTTGKVGNWFGARAFQMGGVGAQAMCTAEPFFYIAANVAITSDGTLRTLAGTGDRYNLIDTNGGQCGPDNIRACQQLGCRVTLSSSGNRVTSGTAGDRQASLAATACGGPTLTEPDIAASSTCGPTGKVNVAIDACPGTTTTTTKNIQLGCTGDARGYGCTAPVVSTGTNLTGLSGAISQINKFFSVRIFELTGKRGLFSTLAGAADYDSARLTDSSLVQLDGAVAAPTVLADSSSAGWALNFNHATSVVIDGVSYTINRVDERVSSTAAVAGSCVYWNTTQTTTGLAAAGKCDVSQCKQVNRRIHYFYGADVTTGAPCGLFDSSGTPIRSTAAVALVPPAAPQYTVFINQKGQVQVGMTSVNTEMGAKNTSAGAALDPATILESIDMPRRLHDCRHADPAGAAPSCK
ncbi:MAG TPA: pilus assembly protein PilY [Anaeromyxobacteraceae bacterium]|nr:pilus assembly protein PilY [Anaeromyxobacteraceae bacterium]